MIVYKKEHPEGSVSHKKEWNDVLIYLQFIILYNVLKLGFLAVC